MRAATKIIFFDDSGEKFFGEGSEGYIRICFATSRGILTEGLNRLEKGIAMLMEEKHLG